jgi:hypothetical protein
MQIKEVIKRVIVKQLTMKIKNVYEESKVMLKRYYHIIKNLPWWHILVVFICIFIATSIFLLLKIKSFKNFDAEETMTNLLTVNAVFSAILISYLFSRITWSKDRKLEIYKEAVTFSQKVTEYRRILNKLTYYYKVWDSDKATKSLIDYSKFRNIDFYEYRLYRTSDYEPSTKALIEELNKHEDFEEGQSTLYLAMVSLVRNRKLQHHQIQHELYKDFEFDGVYNIKVVEKWVQSGIFGTIWYWLDQNANYINYDALRRQWDYILSAASRINKKYEGRELNNELLKDISDDFSSYYIEELYLRLKELKKGITNLNLTIIILITISTFFGILFPFILLLIPSKTFEYSFVAAVVTSINAGLIAYFVLRFPSLISSELKWI